GVLTSITLPEDDDLTTISITYNSSLDEIDLSPLGLLEYAYLNNNSLDTLNLSGNAYLDTLEVQGNELYQLDATPCKKLSWLDVSNNKLYEMKVSTAIPTALNVLKAAHNKLSTFDATGLTKLDVVDLSNNMLKSVNLGTQSLSSLNLSYNHLASLNLKKVTVSGISTIEPQILYANSTDNAVNLKEYDPNFNPDKATLSNGKPMDDDSIFNIAGPAQVPSKAEFTDENTSILITPQLDANGDPKLNEPAQVSVMIDNIVVGENQYSLNPSFGDNGTYQTWGAVLNAVNNGQLTSVTVTGQNQHRGVATVYLKTPGNNGQLTIPTKNLGTGNGENGSGITIGNLTLGSKGYEATPISSDQSFDLDADGTPIHPIPTDVKYVPTTGSSVDLTQGVDYTLSWGANNTPGTGTVIIQGMGEYYGKVTINFTINAAKVPTMDLTNATPVVLTLVDNDGTNSIKNVSVTKNGDITTISGDKIGEEATYSIQDSSGAPVAVGNINPDATSGTYFLVDNSNPQNKCAITEIKVEEAEQEEGDYVLSFVLADGAEAPTPIT
ncbi:MAG: hypothetical protein K2H85_06940, partial [Allobaculum sp.]|nr:hypothetical protein [Allobaculum sp.]